MDDIQAKTSTLRSVYQFQDGHLTGGPAMVFQKKQLEKELPDPGNFTMDLR
jgi:hypothetical protein